MRTKLFHLLGLSCLGRSVFLQAQVFGSILTNGYFVGKENNPYMITLETALTAYTIIYFFYMYTKIIIRKRGKLND